MEIVLSHVSAFLFWRRFTGDITRLKRIRGRRRAGKPRPIDSAMRGELETLGIISDPAHPIHIMVPGADSRSRAACYVCHSESSALPPGSLIRISPRIAVVSPELCFAQISASLDFGRAVMAGCELCGTYAIAQDGSLCQRNPLTSAKTIAAYAAKLFSASSRSAAVTAASHIIDGAASPMEVKLALLLTLPQARGGYGLPAPSLNADVRLGESARVSYPHDRVRPDLFWLACRLAMEYDGVEFHTGDAHAKDVARLNALAAEGIECLTIAFAQIADAAAMDLCARRIARGLGVRFRVRTGDFEKKQMALRSSLGL